jgi:hypothetical protein
MNGSVRDIMRRYKGSSSMALILLTAFSLCAQTPRTPDCLGASKGLFAALDSPKSLPCLYTNRDGVEKAKTCEESGDGRMTKNAALSSIVTYQRHLRTLKAVNGDPEMKWILSNMDRQEWLDAAALIIAGLPGPKDFQQNLVFFQVQMYNDQIEGQGFGEQSFYENAVVPGLELYAVKKWGARWGMTPADLTNLCADPKLDAVVRAQVQKEPAAP